MDISKKNMSQNCSLTVKLVWSVLNWLSCKTVGVGPGSYTCKARTESLLEEYLHWKRDTPLIGLISTALLPPENKLNLQEITTRP